MGRFFFPPRLRRAIAIAAVNAAGILVALCVAEGGARLLGLRPRGAGSGDRSLWRYEPTRGWGLLPGATGEDFRGGPDRGKVRVNPQGFRGAPFARGRPEDRRRILLLGDSFAFGVGVDEDKTVAARLSQFINQDLELTAGHPVDVLNLGVSGYSTDQEILTYESTGLLAVQAVILLMCDNDFEGNLDGFAYGRYYKPRFVPGVDGLRLADTPTPRAERRRPIRTWLFDHSALDGGLLSIAARYRFRDLDRALATGAADRTAVDPVKLMLALLMKLDSEVRATGAVLVTFNTGHRGERTPLFQALRPSLELVGIEHLGLEPALARGRAVHPELPWDFGDDTHWNIAAHELAARVIHLHLRKLARQGKLKLS